MELFNILMGAAAFAIALVAHWGLIMCKTINDEINANIKAVSHD